MTNIGKGYLGNVIKEVRKRIPKEEIYIPESLKKNIKMKLSSAKEIKEAIKKGKTFTIVPTRQGVKIKYKINTSKDNTIEPILKEKIAYYQNGRLIKIEMHY